MSRPAFCEHLKVLASIAWIATASGASERKAWWSPVLLAKQHQGDTGPAQLVMDVGPIRLCLGPGALLTVVTAYRIASSTRSVRPADAARCNVSPTVLRARLSDRTIARSVAATFVLEAQNLPYSTHRHSLVWHRSPSNGERAGDDRSAIEPPAIPEHMKGWRDRFGIGGRLRIGSSGRFPWNQHLRPLDVRGTVGEQVLRSGPKPTGALASRVGA